jgi:hypothetical protein
VATPSKPKELESFHSLAWQVSVSVSGGKRRADVSKASSLIPFSNDPYSSRPALIVGVLIDLSTRLDPQPRTRDDNEEDDDSEDETLDGYKAWDKLFASSAFGHSEFVERSNTVSRSLTYPT